MNYVSAVQISTENTVQICIDFRLKKSTIPYYFLACFSKLVYLFNIFIITITHAIFLVELYIKHLIFNHFLNNKSKEGKALFFLLKM